MDALRLDHVVIRVNDLATAIEDYRSLGFTVVAGGEHPSLGSHNALIAFADGTYLELIAFKGQIVAEDAGVNKERRAQEVKGSGGVARECRVLPWAESSEGFVDYALLPADIDAALARGGTGGLNLEGPFVGGRKRPDGQEIGWQFGFPDAYDLPFFCADVTPRDLRVPGGDACQHRNGAEGIANLTVGVLHLETSRRRLETMIGAKPVEEPQFRVAGGETAEFLIGSSAVTLAQAPPGTILYEQVERRGQGPVSLWLSAPHINKPYFGTDRTHGAFIIFVPEHAKSAFASLPP
jgi:catechol 2,3-dioxygenase-like lactoylglutathione lyase family enzyme